MPIAREGLFLIGAVVVLALILTALGLWLAGMGGWLLVAIGIAALAFTIWFFRDPARQAPEGADAYILAPADGKVIEVVEEDEPLYLKEHARRVSIFLSPLNVHVNRIPVSGTVEYVNYYEGDYLVAWHPKASTLNERSEVGVRHPSGIKVLFKQIAGAVARRIVFYAKEGDEYRAGDRYGIVKFGSRMDVCLPLSVHVLVEPGTKVQAGVTVLARLGGDGGQGEEAVDVDEVAISPS